MICLRVPSVVKTRLMGDESYLLEALFDWALGQERWLQGRINKLIPIQ